MCRDAPPCLLQNASTIQWLTLMPEIDPVRSFDHPFLRHRHVCTFPTFLETITPVIYLKKIMKNAKKKEDVYINTYKEETCIKNNNKTKYTSSKNTHKYIQSTNQWKWKYRNEKWRWERVRQPGEWSCLTRSHSRSLARRLRRTAWTLTKFSLSSFPKVFRVWKLRKIIHNCRNPLEYLLLCKNV